MDDPRNVHSDRRPFVLDRANLSAAAVIFLFIAFAPALIAIGARNAAMDSLTDAINRETHTIDALSTQVSIMQATVAAQQVEISDLRDELKTRLTVK